MFDDNNAQWRAAGGPACILTRACAHASSHYYVVSVLMFALATALSRLSRTQPYSSVERILPEVTWRRHANEHHRLGHPFRRRRTRNTQPRRSTELIHTNVTIQMLVCVLR